MRWGVQSQISLRITFVIRPRILWKISRFWTTFEDGFKNKEKKGRARMTFNGCSHLNAFKASKGTEPFRILHQYFVSCSTAEARKRKVGLWNESDNCQTCQMFKISPLYVEQRYTYVNLSKQSYISQEFVCTHKFFQ